MTCQKWKYNVCNTHPFLDTNGKMSTTGTLKGEFGKTSRKKKSKQVR